MFERRTARIKLAKSIEIVNAYQSRLSTFYTSKFKYEKKVYKDNNQLISFSLLLSLTNTENSLERMVENMDFREGFYARQLIRDKISPEKHVISISKIDFEEFLKLQNEFEQEYLIAKKYADILKPQLIEDRNITAYDSKLKIELNNNAVSYSGLIKTINKFKIKIQ